MGTEQEKSNSRIMATLLAIGSCFALVGVEACQVILASKAKRNGTLIYNSATIVVLVEMCKFLVSFFGMQNEDPTYSELRSVSILHSLRNGVPALLYMINNNIFLYVLTQVQPALFQLLLNLRILWTALLFRFYLGRQVSTRQWLCVFGLILGCSLTQLQNLPTASASLLPSSPAAAIAASSSSASLSANMFGTLLVLLYTFISTIAGVTGEILLKSSVSLHTSNFQLYFFGILFNLVTLYGQQEHQQQQQQRGGGNSFGSSSLFGGWDQPITLFVAAAMATSGLLISRITKHFDSIVKIYCVAASNITVYFYSTLFDDNPFSMTFVLAFIIVSLSAYYYQEDKLAAEHKMDDSLPRMIAKAPLVQNTDDFGDDDNGDGDDDGSGGGGDSLEAHDTDQQWGSGYGGEGRGGRSGSVGRDQDATHAVEMATVLHETCRSPSAL